MVNPDNEQHQPVAGPSSRPWLGVGAMSVAEYWRNGKGKGKQKAVDVHEVSGIKHEAGLARRNLYRQVKRQDAASTSAGTMTSASTSSSSESSTSAYTSSSTTPLFAGPSGSSSSSSSYIPSSSATYSQSSSSSSSSSSSQSSSRSSLPWSTRSKSSASPTQTAYVPGVILNLTLAGDSDTEAVYAVPVQFGHGADASIGTSAAASASASSSDSGEKRATTYDGSAGQVQTVNLQVDLGSSDMWVASSRCRSADCKSASGLFDSTSSLDSGVAANVTYQSGAVSGEISWEQITLGSFQIGYQAFISATTVTNQDLQNGDFGGVLGLAFPAASTILNTIPGGTSSDPDGAVFLDNLFGAGIYAPTQRLFSLALARREDVRTASFLGIGTVSTQLCPSPCSPSYIPIVAQPQLGATGYLHWRIPLQGISITKFSDPQTGHGATTTSISIGNSYVDNKLSTPLAVLDSGGVQILVASRTYADAIYGAFGISMSQDGLYRMPCTQPLALSFTFAGAAYPVHPLDMTYPDPQDPSQATCIGMIQYASNLGDSGDFILGSSFLKNVYSIFQYPDQVRNATWQPTVGLISLLNASVAAQDFYAVRTLRQSLSSVSASQASVAGTTSYSPPSSPSASSAAVSGTKAVSTAIIVACSIAGFFAIAIAAVLLWWFFLRRRVGGTGAGYGARRHRRRGKGGRRGVGVLGFGMGADGAVGAGGDGEGRPETYRSDHSTSTLRSKKHEEVQRQKSMIEGYGYRENDFEGESWASEGNDSIRLGYLPEVAEEEDEGRHRPSSASGSGSGSGLGSGSRGSSQPRFANGGQTGLNLNEKHDFRLDGNEGEGAKKEEDLIDLGLSPPVASRATRRSYSPNSTNLDLDANLAGPYPQPNFAPSTATTNTNSGATPNPPQSRSKSKSRNTVMSMAGPFPSPAINRSSQGGAGGGMTRPDTSPMYDIRSSDYFTVPLVGPDGNTGTGAGAGLPMRGRERRASGLGGDDGLGGGR